jgi:acyl-CoA synthetase (AMP-forming)/AMP-acid ligase II
VPPGERGELLHARLFSVMRGYWDEPEKTREVDRRQARLDAYRRPRQ